MEHLLLVPGFCCDETVWAGQIDLLEDHARCSVVGNGGLDSIGAMADALLRRAPPRFAIAGHSMGGRVALEVIRRAPARVARLALLDSACTAMRRDSDEERDRMALVALAQTGGMPAMAARWVLDMVHPSRLADRALIDAIVGMIARSGIDTLIAHTRALLCRPDLAGTLSDIRVPTLVLAGHEDSRSPPDGQRAMAERIAGSRLVILEQCGHMAPMEQPPEVGSALLSWLSA